MGNIHGNQQENLNEGVNNYAYDLNGVGLPTFNVFLTGLPTSGKTEFLNSICVSGMDNKSINGELKKKKNEYNVGVRSIQCKSESKCFPRFWFNMFDPPSLHLQSTNKIPFFNIICNEKIETTAVIICIDACQILDNGVENSFDDFIDEFYEEEERKEIIEKYAIFIVITKIDLVNAIERDFVTSQIQSFIDKNSKKINTNEKEGGIEDKFDVDGIEHFMQYAKPAQFFVTSAKHGVKTYVMSCILLHLYEQYLKIPNNIVFRRRFNKLNDLNE